MSLVYDFRCELTDGLEGHVSEHCTEVVVEEAFEDVQRDVGEAGVNVGVDSQNYSVRTDNAARDDVSLIPKKHTQKKIHHFETLRKTSFFILTF